MTNDFAFDLRQRHPKIPPFQAIQFIISLNGIYPTRDGPSRLDPVVGEIRMYAHDNVPSDLARCDGQEMQIQDNADLYKVIGTTYGGAGNTFLAPDLRGRFPMHAGQGPGLTVRKLGVPLGSESVTPKVLEEVSVFGKLDGDDPADLENYPLTYTESNMPPFLTINFAICIKGQLPETELPPP